MGTGHQGDETRRDYDGFNAPSHEPRLKTASRGYPISASDQRLDSDYVSDITFDEYTARPHKFRVRHAMLNESMMYASTTTASFIVALARAQSSFCGWTRDVAYRSAREFSDYSV